MNEDERRRHVRRVLVHNKSYNMLTLCTDDFSVESESMRFLMDHEFDMNRLFTAGIAYHKGNDRPPQPSSSNRQFVRSLVHRLAEYRVPVVLHNGFVDLVYLYENFYAKCPESLMKFMADVAEMFAAGLYDTKYMAEFYAHAPASFLEYLFKTCLHKNRRNKQHQQQQHSRPHATTSKDKKYIELKFDSESNYSTFLADYEIEVADAKSPLVDMSKEQLDVFVCKTFAVYGHCGVREGACDKSHSVDDIIRVELVKSRRKTTAANSNKRSVSSSAVGTAKTTNVETHEETLDDEKQTTKAARSHSSGLDAFMTGFVFLNYVNELTQFQTGSSLSPSATSTKYVRLSELTGGDLHSHMSFNMYLTGKDYPLLVLRSNFATTSTNHQ